MTTPLDLFADPAALDRESTIDEILRVPSVRWGPAIGMTAVRRYLDEHGVALPADHQRVLAAANGALAYGGYFRIFGIGTAIDLATWNHRDTWKFAWPGAVHGFLCFGETAWGDEYAYRVTDLVDGADPAVYLLNATGMEEEVLCGNFRELLATELVRNSQQPYDSFLLAARCQLGELAEHEHIVQVPSPLISGRETTDIMKMPAATAMIMNGDLWCQLATELPSRAIDRIEPYTDDQGRTRLRVIWRDP